ncbi:MAG: DUF4065 domain-containing protein [Actinobacteria bacterium]|nr:DUF4065 domain-containing protein [Actinomycetota bacterium]
MDDLNKAIGERIQELRNKFDLTQKALADELGISRPTLSQMENGERFVKAEEIKRVADYFGVSSDVLLGAEKLPAIVLEKVKEYKKAGDIRINVPQKNVAKFKEVFLYILNRIGARPNIGETVLYKLLYFIDFDYYEKHEEQLVGATYIKNKYGPTPLEFKDIIKEMLRSGEIEIVKSEYHKFPQRKYLPLREPNLTILLASEKEVIDVVINRLSGMNAAEISNYSHGDVPWLTTEDGKIIEYESVFYRTPAYSVRSYEDDEV